MSDGEGVGVGAGVFVGVSELEESLGVGLLDVVEGVELLDGVDVGVGVDEELGVDVVDSEEPDDTEGVELEAAPPNSPPRPPSTELTPESRSFFSTTSRWKGFELNQLACARATKTVIRANTRNC